MEPKGLLPEVEVTRGDQVEIKEVEWLWYPYIPYGKITLLQGDPGDGKSTFVLNLAALLTTNRPLPFTEEPREPITVIYQNSEDDAEDTVMPRFLNAGGNPEKIIFINEDKKNLTFADKRIIKAINQEGAKLLILDPVSAYIGADVSMNVSNEVRSHFIPLIQTARDTNCAILCVGHLNKGQGMKALYRTMGSIDFVGAVRSALLIARTSDDVHSPERVLAVQKSNLSAIGKSIIFSIGDKGIDWIEQTEESADEILGNCVSLGRPDDRLSSAKDSILAMLAGGALPALECEDRLKKEGIKMTTAKKAKRELGVCSEKKGTVWYWKLP